MKEFRLHSPFPISGEQEKAAKAIIESIKAGNPCQTLMGITGSGKTFTMAQIIAGLGRPALVISHNKTLAAQLTSEFRDFFPENAVEYFVSYYDYYRPEAYMSSSDTYIEKDCAINPEIDRLRHKATQALLERRDVIIAASVSCIYGLGAPEDYTASSVTLEIGREIRRESLQRSLVQMQYSSNCLIPERGQFRFKGENLEVYPADAEEPLRITFWGDEIESIKRYDHVTGLAIESLKSAVLWPAKHFAVPQEKIDRAIISIKKELDERISFFESSGRLLEAERIKERTLNDLVMLKETGFCRGIENYSRYLTGREEGEAPYTLLDYFPDDFIILIDESHVTVPQLKAMLRGDHARKESLVSYGFRLPSAYDNRPLSIEEFEMKAGSTVFVSATPSDYEKQKSTVTAEQILRPTGLPDPEIIVRRTENCIEDLIKEAEARAAKNERILVTALTKKMAEDLSSYLEEKGVRTNWLHSGVHTSDRIKILHDLRAGKFDCLVGVNLLREGLDLPEVSLVAILDADKEGFLRSETSLIQTIGRAARNISGSVIMYADDITDSMQRAISETNRRRKIQLEYNRIHGIVPETVKKAVKDILGDFSQEENAADAGFSSMSLSELKNIADSLEKKMREAAKKLEFEKAAALRDEMMEARKALISRHETLFTAEERS